MFFTQLKQTTWYYKKGTTIYILNCLQCNKTIKRVEHHKNRLFLSRVFVIIECTFISTLNGGITLTTVWETNCCG
jgi:hypothetical protein